MQPLAENRLNSSSRMPPPPPHTHTVTPRTLRNKCPRSAPAHRRARANVRSVRAQACACVQCTRTCALLGYRYTCARVHANVRTHTVPPLAPAHTCAHAHVHVHRRPRTCARLHRRPRTCARRLRPRDVRTLTPWLVGTSAWGPPLTPDPYMRISTSLYLSVCLYIYLSIDPSIHRSIHPSIHPSIHLPICLSVYLNR
jgi:hypothetical protein